MSEADHWLETQPRNASGKVEVSLLIAEGKRRGYCICPKPLRQLVDFSGLTCSWCLMPETRQSWQFWWGKTEVSE